MSGGKKVLSYCLFSNNQKENRRWDIYQNLENRYFVNIPFLLITREILFPQYKIIFHVDWTSYSNPLFDLVKIMSDDSNIEIKILENTHPNRFVPSVWRMYPFFDPQTDTLYCRDIDSLTTSMEVKTMMFFEISDYVIYTNRSHNPGHKTDRIKILSGLCGFKPHLINLGVSFKEFVNEKDYSIWTYDQFILEKYFYDIEKDKFLDVPTRCLSDLCLNTNKSSFWYEDLQVKLEDHLDDRGLQYLSFLDTLTTWEGEPIDVRCHISKFLSFGSKVNDRIVNIIKSNPILNEFYYV